MGFSPLTSWGNSEYQLYHALLVGGPPPKDWLEFWDLDEFRKRKPDVPSFDKHQAWEIFRLQCSQRSEAFFDLAQKMITTDPGRRSQLAQLLNDPFFPEEPGTAE